MSFLLGLVQTGCLIALAFLLVTAAWQDLRTMRIANGLSIAIIVVFAIWSTAGMALARISIMGLGLSIGCALLVLGVGVLAFAAGGFGGGDAKMLAATSLFAGPALLADLVFVMALVGGLLGLGIAAGLPVGPALRDGRSTVVARRRGGVPYGPAIAAGGLWTIVARLS